ncbi:TPA: HNH endonuclease [Klebsiella aerogenes]
MAAFNYNEMFYYESGNIYWKINASRNTPVGTLAGSKDKSRGYWSVHIKGKSFKRSRIIYEMHHGPIPSGMQIDHINGVTSDDRIENLRIATQSENQMNRGIMKHNSSGVRGVSWDPRKQRWRAQVQINGRCRHLGYFKEKHEAAIAAESGRRSLFGEFARVGD